MDITLHAIGIVKNIRKEITDDFWGSVVSEITLSEDIPADAFSNISDFSHLEIIFHFDKVAEDKIMYSGLPRGNPDYPMMGIFAQRKKDRPNRIGLCTAKLLSHNDRVITVQGLDAIDGTPVLDIKPVFKEFQPVGDIKQPGWVAALMKDYWR